MVDGEAQPDAQQPAQNGTEPLIRRVTIRNYKSIGKCDVSLGALSVLVGRNGAGKSNFLDALRFVADGLQTTLDQAIRSRGGIDRVRRLSTGNPRNFLIRLEVNLPRRQVATYAFEVASRQGGGFSVKQESLTVRRSDNSVAARYRVSAGKIIEPADEVMPPPSADRLYLVYAAGLPLFRETYDALTSMGFYNLNPDVMRLPQSPDAGELLECDGRNIASVMDRTTANNSTIAKRILEYLVHIVPGITDVKRIALGSLETLEFHQKVRGSPYPWKFDASSMSDGTLRVLGSLVAVLQSTSPHVSVRLAGIEEPETALHPAAAGALMDALREAAVRTQVVITSHAPALLDEIDPETDHLIAVQSNDGTTELGPVSSANRDAIRDHLYTAGDLLRMDQLEPDRRDIERQEQLPPLDDGGFE